MNNQGTTSPNNRPRYYAKLPTALEGEGYTHIAHITWLLGMQLAPHLDVTVVRALMAQARGYGLNSIRLILVDQEE